MPLDFSHLEPESIAGKVAMLLSENPAITAITGNRILDYDPRTMGWDLTPDNVQIYTPDRRIQTTIVVDDNGGSPAFGGPVEASTEEVYIWVLSGATINAAREVPKLMRIIRPYLFQKRLPGGGVMSWRFTMGPGGTDDGWMGRMTYGINGIFAP